MMFCVFFKQKTAYEMRISDWSSDVCSSDLLALGAVASISLVGCAATDYGVEPDDDFPQALTASAQLLDASGRAMGTATATQSGDSIRLRTEGVGLPSVAHGAHVHMTGQCLAPGFDRAARHSNPTTRGHGTENPAGMTKGDMPTIPIGTYRAGTPEYKSDTTQP